VGTKFVFELKSVGVRDPVEVQGTVASVSESAPGKWVLHIRYEQPRSREGLDAVIGRIFEGARADLKRRHARVPLQVRAVEDKPHAPVFRLRDISRGGVGIDVEGNSLPAYIQVGTAFMLQMKLTEGTLAVGGEVAWAVTSKQDAFPPRVGVRFTHVSSDMRGLLEELLALRAMPSPPWIARLRFGPDASAKPAAVPA
jgi:Tfp pilus assembly protein PilZ